MAFSDYVLALAAVFGVLLVPFVGFYQMVRLKRRAFRIPVPTAPSSKGNRR